MLIAIHDADAEHLKRRDKFPNLALMKISAWHKSMGDTVEWFNPIESHLYDKVYSSKVFDFTPENDYLPPDTIKGGTGYGMFGELPREIDDMFPDYSIYPECDYAIGFLTRGCPNKCSNCYVPQKEGAIRPYRTWQQIVRPDTKKLVLMDNNITAHPHGIEQLRQLAETDYAIDINQATSVFSITPEIAQIFAKLKWIKYIRFACDRKPQIQGIYKAANLLEEAGIPNSRLFVYVLITKDLRAARIAKEMGYEKIITYILQTENGASLRACGWVEETTTSGGHWSRPSRKRTTSAPTCPKKRYAKYLKGGVT